MNTKTIQDKEFRGYCIHNYKTINKELRLRKCKICGHIIKINKG